MGDYGYLDYYENLIKAFLMPKDDQPVPPEEAFLEREERAPVVTILPYTEPGKQGLDEYTAMNMERLKAMGFDSVSDHTGGSPEKMIMEAEAFFVPGGNTWAFMYELTAVHGNSIIYRIRSRVLFGGVPYIGVSAGTNLACPTIHTTNDMPVKMPTRTKGLGLVPFQINAHFPDPDPERQLTNETREERLLEYVAWNGKPVLALREGGVVRRTG